jgi:glutamate/tyrosine decarboxylase-like PLP-dependent enzyme
MYKYQHGLDVSTQLRELTPPIHGTSFEELLDTVFNIALPCGLMQHHPGGMAHVPSGGLVQGAVGEFISRAVNRFAGVWMDNPGFSQIETNVIHWFCQMIGYGERSFGYLTTGGSTANLIGIVCASQLALEKAKGSERIVYMSAQSHFSNRKAAKIAGYTEDRIRNVQINDDFTMNVDSLVNAIVADIEAGHFPTCVIATAGTTNTGAIDDLAAVATICQKYNIWLHVDAAWGGFFHITQRGKVFLSGIELADSITVDAQKSLFLPHGISAVLVKERSNLRNTFQISAEYIMGFSRDEIHNDFCQLGPELTREIRGLTVWLPLKMHGLSAFELCLDRAMDLAAGLLVELKTVPEIAVIQVHKLHLPVVNFQVLGATAKESEDRTRAVCEKICSYGNVFLVTTELPGYGVVLRVCIQHHLTDEGTIAHLLGDLRKALNVVCVRI